MFFYKISVPFKCPKCDIHRLGLKFGLSGWVSGTEIGPKSFEKVFRDGPPEMRR